MFIYNNFIYFIPYYNQDLKEEIGKMAVMLNLN